MSSWGSWSKISKLQQVGDFSFSGSNCTTMRDRERDTERDRERYRERDQERGA